MEVIPTGMLEAVSESVFLLRRWVELVSGMGRASDSEEELRSVTGSVSRCAAGVICWHVRVAAETVWRIFAARAQAPRGLGWMPSLLKKGCTLPQRLKLAIKTQLWEEQAD